ncbi:MAG TPA: HRDC domain-containing protein, partial [bacterium]|nr:HRDC domain-containing protein [bacterium]
REGLARKRDCPPFKILDNETVRRMVNQPPLTEAELLRIRMFSRKTPEFRQSLLQAVRTGLSCPEEKLPVYPKFFRVPGWPGEKEKEERERMLKSWRQAKSMSLGLAPGLLLTTKQLRELAEKAPLRLPDLNKVEGLRNWQKRVFGEELCYLLRRSAGKEK